MKVYILIYPFSNISYIAHLSQSTTVGEENETAGVKDVTEAGEENGINFLSAWPLPNIADWRSVMFSMHFLVV